MPVYRFFPWNKSSPLTEYGGPFFAPRAKQGAGRHDIPDRDGVLYCSTSAMGAIAEAVQPFRGLRFIDKKFGLMNSDFRKADGLPLALATLEISEKAQLVDLNEPVTLSKYHLKPSHISSTDRKETQHVARLLYEEGLDGFSWRSSLEPSWVHMTLFQSRISPYLSIKGEVRLLDVQMPEIKELAQKWDLNI